VLNVGEIRCPFEIPIYEKPDPDELICGPPSQHNGQRSHWDYRRYLPAPDCQSMAQEARLCSKLSSPNLSY
jgi:hypothetical protein